MRTTFILVGVLSGSPAIAGSCDAYVRKAATATGADLVTAYTKLQSCDAELAKASFETFMLKATDLDTLVPLARTAISGAAYTEVWSMMGRVPYEFRRDLAAGIGAACTEQADIVPFLQGAHVALKGVEFTSWTPALSACQAEDFEAWVADSLKQPPTSTYNEKYNALLTAWVDANGVEGMPVLEEAAVAAGKGDGPFTSVLDAMRKSIQPDSVRSSVTPENQALLEDALVRVAQQIPPEPARSVADQLYSAGNEAKAASLLPALYPDRVQAGGEMMWAAAAVEACEGEAVVHWAAWTEKPTRLDIVSAASGPLRELKPKLKCSDDAPWPVRAPTAPVTDRDAAETWVDEIVAELDASGTKAKAREEKKLALP